MRILWSALLALAIVGCGDSVTEPDAISGSYSLQSVNGLELPYELADVGGTRLEVLSGEMALDSNGGLRYDLRLRVTTPEDEYFRQYSPDVFYEEFFREMALGRWVSEGNDLRLKLGGDELLGMVEGRAITLSKMVRGVEGRNLAGEVMIPFVAYPLTLVFQPRN
jgi:hypothetical protein